MISYRNYEVIIDKLLPPSFKAKVCQQLCNQAKGIRGGEERAKVHLRSGALFFFFFEKQGLRLKWILQNQVSEPARIRTPHQTNVFTETADPNVILEYPF